MNHLSDEGRMIVGALEYLGRRLDDIEVVLRVLDVRTSGMAELLELADAEIAEDVEEADDVAPPAWVRQRTPPDS